MSSNTMNLTYVPDPTKADGAPVSGGGAAQTPWTSDISAAGFSLTGLLNLALTGNITQSGAAALNAFAGNTQFGSTSVTALEPVQTQGRLVLDANSYARTKFDSQGTAWSSSVQNAIVFNGGINDRPEISWIRGTRTFPEFSIREHTTADSGGQIYSGAGTVAPSLTMSFLGGKVGIGTLGGATPTHALTFPQSSSGIVLYNTADQTTNLERFRMAWSSNTFVITAEAGGGGTQRNTQFIGIGLGIGRTAVTPTAIVHIGSGSNAAGSAPLKFSTASGFRLTTTEAGAFEYNGYFYATEAFGSVRYGMGGAIFDHFADAGNTTTTETDLYTDTLKASTFGTNGCKVFAEYGGTLVGHASATREWRVYLGGTIIFDSGALVITTNQSWNCKVFLIRAASNSVRYTIVFNVAGLTTEVYTSTGNVTLTLSSAQILKITGQAGTGGSTNDIVATIGMVNFVVPA